VAKKKAVMVLKELQCGEGSLPINSHHTFIMRIMLRFSISIFSTKVTEHTQKNLAKTLCWSSKFACVMKTLF